MNISINTLFYDFDANHYFKNTINECDEIVEKTFYRTKEEFN